MTRAVNGTAIKLLDVGKTQMYLVLTGMNIICDTVVMHLFVIGPM